MDDAASQVTGTTSATLHRGTLIYESHLPKAGDREALSVCLGVIFADS